MSFLIKRYGAVTKIILILVFFGSLPIMAAVKEYHLTENEGLYKPERFDSIERHLIELTSAFNKLEEKVEANSKMIKMLEEKGRTVKVSESLKTELVPEEGKSSIKKLEEELKKVNADLLVIKDKDIEKMKEDIRQLFISDKILQQRLH